MDQAALILRTVLLLLLMCGTDAKIEIITSKQDISVGEEILLLCKVGAEGHITWHKDDEEIDDEEKVKRVDETSSKLIIKMATLQDAGRYICLCEFDSGHNDNVAKQLYVYEGPSFEQTPTYHEFLEGTDGVVPCFGTGLPAVDINWIREKQVIPFHEGRRVRQLTSNSLLIEKVKKEDAGTYYCQAQIRGRPIYKHLSISVFVNVPPTVLLKQSEEKVLAGPQTDFSLLCLVDGLPKPNITWTMPVPIDPSRHRFNSDRSQLTVMSVARADYGEYVCTATNKIAESSASIIPHVYVTPEVFVSAKQMSVSMGERLSVSCNVSGLLQPELYWLNKHNGRTLGSTSGRVHVVDGVLVIEEVVPSDGGLYSCMAVTISQNASRDVAIHTQPGQPPYLKVSPGPSSFLISLKTSPISGGTPITGFVLQWRQTAAEHWEEIAIPSSDPLSISGLKQYTEYTVRLAAVNAVGVGQFSDTIHVRTQAIREPDSPALLVDKMRVERNSFSIPLKQVDDGASPLQHFKLRYRQDKVGAKWEEKLLSSNAASISLQDLSFSSGYQLDVTAVNANGSSVPASLNFTIGGQPVSSRMTKGSMVAIVAVIFLVVFLLVDATCCYRNHCGLLMSIAEKLFGEKVPGMMIIEDIEGTTNGGGDLRGMTTPRGSGQLVGVQTTEAAGMGNKPKSMLKVIMTRGNLFSPSHMPSSWENTASNTLQYPTDCQCMRPEQRKKKKPQS